MMFRATPLDSVLMVRQGFEFQSPEMATSFVTAMSDGYDGFFHELSSCGRNVTMMYPNEFRRMTESLILGFVIGYRISSDNDIRRRSAHLS